MRECVLLDFDSTVTTRDTTKFLLFELIKLRPFRIVGAILFVLMMFFSKESDSSQKYKNRAIGYLIKGSSDTDLSTATLAFCEKVRPLFRSFFIQKITEHHKKGAFVLIVTASPSFVIDRCVSDLPVTVIGTNFSKDDGVYSGQIKGLNCFGQQKVTRIEAWEKKNNLDCHYIEAWSDDFTDSPMLNMAETRYLIGREALVQEV